MIYHFLQLFKSKKLLYFHLFTDYSRNNHERSRSATPSIVNPQKVLPPKNPPMFITVREKIKSYGLLSSF